ncbi:TROVE domain-containing protein [Nocardiopsis sp. FR26]|uniref:TROVE domain-containing protein n=1 Tax=Nocardiopsis sp. FR26 TaxID=2605987 RepID=UPI00135B4FC0|nr:TROVE domain-containing protein [Nocardiopsis sp. FR26]
MAKFNTRTARTATRSPVATEAAPSGRTFEGGPGYARDRRSELFLFAVNNLVGEATHYESAADRDARFRALVHQVALSDPVWLTGFIGWLRGPANLRTAPLVAAAEMAHARTQAGAHGHTRQAVAAALQRADEPGELLAYWLGRYGRPLPIALKRGVADAAVRLYTERSLLKYDTDSHSVRFGDVIDLVQPRYHHPKVRGTAQDALFGYALDRRHGRNVAIPDELETLGQRAELMSWPLEQRRALMSAPAANILLQGAGMTWEAVASWLEGPMDAAAWEAVIPSMGYGALLRNLRNFDQAGVSDEVAAQVAARLADPDEVARSRQLPFRFLSAYRQVASLRWAWPLEQALGHALSNIPALPGRTLVLVDRSPSMWWHKLSEHSTMDWAEAAAVFGAAVALRAEHADLVEFGMANQPVHFHRGESVLKVVERFGRHDGTDIPSALAAHLNGGHDRVVIITDEQTRPGWLPSNAAGHGGRGPTRIDDLVPARTPLYMWNFAGYQHGATPAGTGNRHTFGGLSDAAFRMVPLLEAGRNAAWPWE